MVKSIGNKDEFERFMFHLGTVVSIRVAVWEIGLDAERAFILVVCFSHQYFFILQFQ